MAWPHDLHCPTDVSAPQPVGWCDRCYQKYYLNDLNWQYDIRGDSLTNIGLRVCPKCYDEPNEVLRPVEIRGPEGVVRDPRPPYYAANFLGGEPPIAYFVPPGMPDPGAIPEDMFNPGVEGTGPAPGNALGTGTGPGDLLGVKGP
jgi:hypothetical protein